MDKSIHYFMKPLILINAFIIISAEFLTPLWGDFVRHIGGDITVAGKAICIFSIVIGLLTCFAAKIESKFRDKDEIFMLLSSIGMTFSYLGFFFVHHPWQLYCVETALGIAAAFQVPALYALYHRHLPKGKSGLNWGIWNGFYNISVGIGSLAGAYVLHFLSFNMVFFMMFLISFIGLIYTFFVTRKMKKLRDFFD